jgi:hypothetical protein
MKLPDNLISEFAKTTNDTPKNQNRNSSVYGTTVVENGQKFVRLDGSEILTPMTEGTDAQDGDRVLVNIHNRQATVIGNITCPASARTASSFIKPREDGLLVASLDENGNNIGTGSLIAPGTYYIIDNKGNKIASFSGSSVMFCENKCGIGSQDGAMVLQAPTAVGMRTDDSSVILTDKGVSLQGDIATFNNYEILNTSNVLKRGVITGKGSIKAGKYIKLKMEVSVPSEYELMGIREVRTNHPWACRITGFHTDPTTNKVGATIYNGYNGDFNDLEVTIEWFALRSNKVLYDVEQDLLNFDIEAEGEVEP